MAGSVAQQVQTGNVQNDNHKNRLEMLERTAVFKYVCSRLPPVPGSDLQMMSVGFNRGYVLEHAFEDGMFTKSVYGFVAYKGAL